MQKDIIEDDDNDETVSGLPTWAWVGAVIVITVSLLGYIHYS